MILDASHNPEGAEVLANNLRHLWVETGKKPVVITGALGSSRAQPLLVSICEFAKEVHLVVPHQIRACSHEELEALVPKEFTGLVTRDCVEGLFPGENQCSVGGVDDIIVVTGSIYLLGEIMARVLPGLGASEGRLQDF